MTDKDKPMGWDKTTFDGSRHEQLQQTQKMTVRQRLEALDQLTALSERMQAMPKQAAQDATANGMASVREPHPEYHAPGPNHEIILEGCTPTPLANYLKALGVLRLLSTKHPEVRGAWRGDRFVLSTTLSREEIEHFFLNEYEPTPIMAPWNGGSGFYEKDNKTALNAIQQSTNPRLALYRTCLDAAEQALAGLDRKASPKGDDKAILLSRIRGLLPEAALGWFDASVSLSGGSAQYPPLLGTGGNDGRLDFTNNFMQRLTDIMDCHQEQTHTKSQQWLAMTLFGDAAPSLAKNAIGQFAPGQAGGPNANVGFDADAAINPWDFVLMIEGALGFASTTARRNASDAAGVLSYPFTVRAVGAGSGSLGEGDTANARGELWMPLWKQAATYAEIHTLLAEGRVALGRTPARDALDFVRAVHHLGGYRGIQSFQRFGLLMRSGKAFLATPLARVEVGDQPRSRWLDDLDKQQWLERFRQFGRGDNTPNRFRTLRKRLEDTLFSLSGREPSRAEAQALLKLLGEIQLALSNSQNAKEIPIHPVPRLSEQWVTHADDNTPAFRIAKALAGLHGERERPLPLRAQLFPVQRIHTQWMTPEAHERFRIHTGIKGRLVDTLYGLLHRRLWLADKLEMTDKPLSSPAGATLEDIALFLRDKRLDDEIAKLLPGLCLCEIPRDTEKTREECGMPAAFGLLKLGLTPDRTLQKLNLLPENTGLPVPTGMLAKLVTGEHSKDQAVQIAWRRLRDLKQPPIFDRGTLPKLGDIDPRRAAAALLIPLRDEATRALSRTLLHDDKPETELA